MDKDSAMRLLVIKTAADHASQAHRGQFRKDRRTPYITHPARVAGLIGSFNGSHIAIIAAWLHDVYEDCSPEWILKTDDLINAFPLPSGEKREIARIVDAMTKKNTIPGKASRLSDSLNRILDAPLRQHSSSSATASTTSMTRRTATGGSRSAILHQPMSSSINSRCGLRFTGTMSRWIFLCRSGTQT